MDFQAAFDQAVAEFRAGVEEIALEIARLALYGQAKDPKVELEPPPAKPKAPSVKLSHGEWMIKQIEERDKKRKAKARKAKARRPKPTKNPGVLVGELWRRRDGKEPRRILNYDDMYIVVESPKYKAGTKVKLAEFFRRYKLVQPLPVEHFQ